MSLIGQCIACWLTPISVIQHRNYRCPRAIKSYAHRCEEQMSMHNFIEIKITSSLNCKGTSLVWGLRLQRYSKIPMDFNSQYLSYFCYVFKYCDMSTHCQATTLWPTHDTLSQQKNWVMQPVSRQRLGKHFRVCSDVKQQWIETTWRVFCRSAPKVYGDNNFRLREVLGWRSEQSYLRNRESRMRSRHGKESKWIQQLRIQGR
jgi:hypothetical protein